MLKTIEVRKRVAEIKASAGDAEKAHRLENELHFDVLNAIAASTCEDPAACARAALKTRLIDFPRWCA